MSDYRTLRLELHWAETKVQGDGSVHLTIAGVTSGGAGHKVVFKMGPATIGYIADDLHRAVAELQLQLDRVKAQLRGQ